MGTLTKKPSGGAGVGFKAVDRHVARQISMAHLDVPVFSWAVAAPTNAEWKARYAVDTKVGDFACDSNASYRLMVCTVAGTTPTWAAVGAAASLDLQGAFVNGKAITGADSSTNAFKVGDSTDYLRLYRNAANDLRIDSQSGETLTIAPAGNLTLAPVGAVTAVTGAMTVSTTLAVTGALTAGSFSVASFTADAIAAATTNQTLAINGNGAGGVNIGAVSTGAITLSANVAVAASMTVTVAGVAGSNVFTITAGDVVMSDGSITMTDADDAASLSLTNASAATVAGLILVTAANISSGTIMKLVGNATFSGGGAYIDCHDGSASDFKVARYGAVTIAGNASTDILTITAGHAVLTQGNLTLTSGNATLTSGNLAMTAGKIDIAEGYIEVDSALDTASYIKRNYAGAGTAALLKLWDAHASTTNAALEIVHAGTGTVPAAVSIAYAGTGDALKITTSKVTGVGLELVCAASTTTSMLKVDGSTGDWIGASAVGMVDLVCDGALAHANASCLRIAYSGTGAATGLGTSIRVVDTGATSTSYAVYINASTANAFYVAAGGVRIDSTITLGTAGLTIAQAATTVDFDAGSANEDIRFGYNTDTDVYLYGATVTDFIGWVAATKTLSVAGTAVVSFGATTGLLIPNGADPTASAVAAAGSICFETDAKKIWVYDGSSWVSVTLA